MAQQGTLQTRDQQVWSSLAVVTDPELDESVTELGFVRSVEVSGADVQIQFHLPTYWCAANFAYMMASDMHRVVRALPWVQKIEVELIEHMYAETINQGVNSMGTFQDTFGDEASDEINSVRRLFRQKAYQQRQECLLRRLLDCDYSESLLTSMTLSELKNWDGGSSEDSRLLQRYLEIRQEFGGDAGSQQLAFVTLEGDRIKLAQFAEYLQLLRRTRINTQFNGEMCRGLLQARYGSQQAGPQAVRVDFHPRADFQSTHSQSAQVLSTPAQMEKQ